MEDLSKIVETLAANNQKLRVAVTKTSAQGEEAQKTTPNMMSFSNDENSIWFNGKLETFKSYKGMKLRLDKIIETWSLRKSA